MLEVRSCLALILAFTLAGSARSEQRATLQAMFPALQADFRDLLLSEDFQEGTREFDAEMQALLLSCSIHAVDLDDDTIPDAILWVGWRSGNHHNSRLLPVLKRECNGEWKSIGGLVGSFLRLLESRHGGLRDIETWWYGGGPDGIATTYSYIDGRYKETSRREVRLQGH